MSEPSIFSRLARRSFLSRAGAGAAAFAAALGVGRAAAASPAGIASEPVRHGEDDWFDQPAAKHRMIFDTTSPEFFGQALAWCRNFLDASKTGYSLTDADAALIVCARHTATAFAYSDAIWAKYGAVLSEGSEGFVDPKTKQAPAINVYLASGYGDALRNYGVPLDAMLKRGVRLAVCGMATRRLSGLIAKKNGMPVDDVFKELSGNLVANARIVPAGIIAVSRAQERGYTLATVA